MRLVVALTLNIYIRTYASEKHCLIEGQFLQEPPKEKLFKYALLPLEDGMGCMKMCLARSPCVGIGMDSICVLYRTLPNKRSLEQQPINIIPRSLFPKKLAGPCADFQTKDNEMCAISPQGKPVTLVTGCAGLPPLADGKIMKHEDHGQGVIYPINHTLEYRCKPNHLPLGTLRCNPSGFWSKSVCIKLFSSCKKVKRCNRNYEDGEYFLWTGKTLMKVYCHEMKSSRPSMYITLPSSFATISNRKEECLPVNPHTNRRQCGKTIWRKLKVKMASLSSVEVARYTNTFFTETCKGGHLGFASTTGCSQTGQCKTDIPNSIHLNLTGTGFKWTNKFTGYNNGKPKSHVTEDGHVVDVICTSYTQQCGWCLPKPASTLTSLRVDRPFEHDIDSAVAPVCRHRNN